MERRRSCATCQDLASNSSILFTVNAGILIVHVTFRTLSICNDYQQAIYRAIPG